MPHQHIYSPLADSKLQVTIPVLFSFLLIFSLCIPAKLQATGGHTNDWLFTLQAAPVDTIPLKKEYSEELATITAQLEKDDYEIKQLLQDPRFEIYGTIDERFINSAEKTSFSLEEYKEILDFEEKSHQIVDFIDEHFNQLEKAEKDYGISKYIIAAIIGLESNFGQNIGSHNPFNVYISMMLVDYRSDFAEAQLKELLEFTNRKGIDVFTLKSSYAGAMSYAQFIPYSVNKWWVGDNIFDMGDNIMSVANYLAYFKERTDDRETMIMRYNPSSLYANAILDLAEAGEKNYMRAKETEWE